MEGKVDGPSPLPSPARRSGQPGDRSLRSGHRQPLLATGQIDMTSRLSGVFAGLACAAVLATSSPAGAVTNVYKVAHVKHQNANMVIVLVSPRFFNGSSADQRRWFTGIEQCVRSVNLAGQTLLVTNDNGRYRYYGPNAWHDFLRTTNINWVDARINKSITCNF